MVATHKLVNTGIRATSPDRNVPTVPSISYDVEDLAHGTKNSGSWPGTGPSWRDTLNGALAGGETTVPVDDGTKFEVGAKITIGTSAGHDVTAVATNDLTVTPAVVGAQSDGADVVPDITHTSFWTSAVDKIEAAEAAAHSGMLFS